jgi:hypothetical protein
MKQYLPRHGIIRPPGLMSLCADAALIAGAGPPIKAGRLTFRINKAALRPPSASLVPK